MKIALKDCDYRTRSMQTIRQQVWIEPFVALSGWERPRIVIDWMNFMHIYWCRYKTSTIIEDGRIMKHQWNWSLTQSPKQLIVAHLLLGWMVTYCDYGSKIEKSIHFYQLYYLKKLEVYYVPTASLFFTTINAKLF